MTFRLITFFITLIFLQPQSLYTQFEVSENCLTAWEQIMDLKFTSARETIDEELRHNPTNHYAYYLEQCNDALALVIDPSKERYKVFEENYERRMDIMENADEDSPYYLACKSEMLLQMCIFNVLYGDKISGVRKGYKAFKATYRNRDKYPDFALSKKLDGFFNVAVSNMPSFVRWAASVFGVSGNAEVGVNLLKDYYQSVKKTHGLNLDAAVYVILPYKLNKEPEKAFAFMETLDPPMVDYKLLKYFYINTAYRSGQNDLAYETIQKFNVTEVEVPFPPYDYMMGKILLRKLDKDAINYFQQYLRQTDNENYIKETFYNIALHYYVQGDVEQFKYYKLQAFENGKAVNERDRETLYDSELDYIPNVNLIKTKLLLDGGYVDAASKQLDEFGNHTHPLYKPDIVESNLLRARILVKKGKIKEAIERFNLVLDNGSNLDYYFACEAAIRLGWVYLDSDKTLAKSYFEEALDLYQSDFYEYLEEIAKRELKILEDI